MIRVREPHTWLRISTLIGVHAIYIPNSLCLETKAGPTASTLSGYACEEAKKKQNVIPHRGVEPRSPRSFQEN